MEWYEDDGNCIGQLENEETHTTGIYARKMGDDWEYAIVAWHHGHSFLICTLIGGRRDSEYAKKKVVHCYKSCPSWADGDAIHGVIVTPETCGIPFGTLVKPEDITCEKCKARLRKKEDEVK